MSNPEPPTSLEEHKRELESHIRQHQEEYQRLVAHLHQIYLEAIEPYINELTDIARHETPADVHLLDGRIMHYIGPKVHWTGNGWDMSELDKEEAK